MSRKAGSPGRDDVYDKAFKTIAQDAPSLLIPLVNHMFGRSYTDKAEIRFASDQAIYLDRTRRHRLMADLHIIVAENGAEEDFLLEIQSTPDSEIFNRISRYILGVTMRVLKDKTVDGHPYSVAKAPRTGLIYLRAPKKLTSPARLQIELSAGSAVHETPILRLVQMTLEDLLQNRLTVLVPFHLFRYASELAEIEQDKVRRETLLSEYRRIADTLNEYAASGEISTQESKLLAVLTEEVVNALASNQPLIREGK